MAIKLAAENDFTKIIFCQGREFPLGVNSSDPA